MKKKVEKKPLTNETVLRLKTELDVFKNYLKKDVSMPIVASFGFIIALVWRDAIRATIDEFLKRLDVIEKVYIYEIVSAIIVTILIAIVMIFVTEFSKSRKTKRIKEEIKEVKKTVKEDLKKLEDSDKNTK